MYHLRYCGLISAREFHTLEYARERAKTYVRVFGEPVEIWFTAKTGIYTWVDTITEI